jgi:dienelactone hydrolase
VNAIQKAFAGKPKAEIKVYQGATHNFSMPKKEGYHAAAAKASREAALKCFRSM